MSNKQHSFVSAIMTLGLLAALIGGVLSGARAQEKHPHYLLALSDLRAAHAWLDAEAPDRVKALSKDATTHIEEAMADIKRASIDDGKDLSDHPPIDANLQHKDRLHRALTLLSSADKDLKYSEDDQKALGWRKSARNHVFNAMRLTLLAIKAAQRSK